MKAKKPAKKVMTPAADMKTDALNGFTEGGRADMKLDMMLKPKKKAALPFKKV